LSQLPNLLTAIRLVLTPFLVAAILQGKWTQAFWIGIAAGVTDALDGPAARLLRVSSTVGAYADPIVDKVMLSAAYIALGIVKALPWWMVAMVFARDLFILSMAAYGYLFTTIRDFPPTIWGKLSTFVQIFTAMALIFNRAITPVPVAPFLWTMVATTTWSGIHYGYRGLRLLESGMAEWRKG
jgi:cardiolipin synthase (CMP-forming)